MYLPDRIKLVTAVSWALVSSNLPEFQSTGVLANWFANERFNSISKATVLQWPKNCYGPWVKMNNWTAVKEADHIAAARAIAKPYIEKRNSCDELDQWDPWTIGPPTIRHLAILNGDGSTVGSKAPVPLTKMRCTWIVEVSLVIAVYLRTGGGRSPG